MKKSALLFALFFFLVTCQKNESENYGNTLVNENEIPNWLKSQILLQSKKEISSTSAWIRYKWNNEAYFEYYNLSSSTFAYPISFSGDTLKTCPVCKGNDYNDHKCCKQFIWKGSHYIE